MGVLCAMGRFLYWGIFCIILDRILGSFIKYLFSAECLIF